MRHLLLALLIALLPLRAWVSDAMAVSMIAAAPVHEAMATGQADATPCPDHLMAGQDMDSSSADDGSHEHSACDVCNGPAMSLSSQAALALTVAHGQIVGSPERFASLSVPAGTKPPIS
ncbi:MAG: hypothetical protein AB7S86_05135 [Hydrogenophaga sp.]